MNRIESTGVSAPLIWFYFSCKSALEEIKAPPISTL